MEFLQDSAFVTAVLCWFIAQLIKVISVLIIDRKLDLRRFVGSGGMPSSHSAFVMGLTTSVGFSSGFSSDMFAIAAVLAFVVMYDATGVRRAAGEQAKVLNQMVEERDGPETTEVQLKELLGHTPLQVFAGAALGITVAIIKEFGI